jgi:hypothetical protein
VKHYTVLHHALLSDSELSLVESGTVSSQLKGKGEREGRKTARRREDSNISAAHYLVTFYLIGTQADIDFEFLILRFE